MIVGNRMIVFFRTNSWRRQLSINFFFVTEANEYFLFWSFLSISLLVTFSFFFFPANKLSFLWNWKTDAILLLVITMSFNWLVETECVLKPLEIVSHSLTHSLILTPIHPLQFSIVLLFFVHPSNEFSNVTSQVVLLPIDDTIRQVTPKRTSWLVDNTGRQLSTRTLTLFVCSSKIPMSFLFAG